MNTATPTLFDDLTSPVVNSVARTPTVSPLAVGSSMHAPGATHKHSLKPTPGSELKTQAKKGKKKKGKDQKAESLPDWTRKDLQDALTIQDAIESASVERTSQETHLDSARGDADANSSSTSSPTPEHQIAEEESTNTHKGKDSSKRRKDY
jgi:hypothetical protein